MSPVIVQPLAHAYFFEASVVPLAVGVPRWLVSVSVTTDRPLLGDESAKNTPPGPLGKQAPHSQRRATLARRDTQLRRERAPGTARVRVRCQRDLRATLQPR